MLARKRKWAKQTNLDWRAHTRIQKKRLVLRISLSSFGGKCLCGERWQIYNAIPFVHVVNHVKSLMNPLFSVQSPFSLPFFLRSFCFCSFSLPFLQMCVRLRAVSVLFFITWLDADRLLRITQLTHVLNFLKLWDICIWFTTIIYFIHICECVCVHVNVIEIREWHKNSIPWLLARQRKWEKKLEINFRNLNGCVCVLCARRKREKRGQR